jgi:hypothetical protein
MGLIVPTTLTPHVEIDSLFLSPDLPVISTLTAVLYRASLARAGVRSS